MPERVRASSRFFRQFVCPEWHLDKGVFRGKFPPTKGGGKGWRGMRWKTPMFEPMRKLMGRCGRSLRRAMEAERSELLRQGFGGMTRVLSRWIDPKLMAPERE